MEKEMVKRKNTRAHGIHMDVGLAGDRRAPSRNHGIFKGKVPEFKVSANLAGSSPNPVTPTRQLQMPHHYKPALPSSDPASNTCHIRNQNIGEKHRNRREPTRGFRGYGGVLV